MQITEVRIYPEDNEELRGYASITFDDTFRVHDFKIIRNDSGGLYVAMPNKKDKKHGGYCEIAYPITAEARAMIEEAILTTYRAVCEQQNAPRGAL